MSNTLSFTDTIQRVGYTIIEGVKVVQYTCVIPLANPEDMRTGVTRLNPDMYRDVRYREICRADYAAFEDSAFELQDEMLAKIGG